MWAGDDTAGRCSGALDVDDVHLSYNKKVIRYRLR